MRPCFTQLIMRENVYAAGKIFSTGSGFDIFVSKYDANGSTIWERTFDGTGNAKDIAYAVKVDNSGNVFVAGESTGDRTGADFVTIEYSSDGSEQWINRYDGNSNSMDFIEKLLIDDLGNVIVLGTSYEIGNLFDLVLIKYSNAGIMQWTKTYNGQASGNDIADDLALDAAGNIFVAANSFGSGTLSDFLILKYNSNGDTLWCRRYNGPVNGHDNFTSMTIDNNGNIAIAGSSVGSGTSLDFAVLKYSSMGELLWLRRYTGPATSSPDEPKAIAHDSAGNIYVTGTSVGQSTSYDYLTVKYSPSGDMIWDRRYTGQFNNSFDEPTGVCTRCKRQCLRCGNE
ncbi:MAG: SBBP repeat-containing protein [Ignavibacteria bacterium]|nr:SBBP repeat-containing protein [Ignavibacteria bacterium]